MILYHITTQSQYQKYSSDPYYLPVGYLADGFIHCSTTDQVLKVAENYYKNDPELILLKIDLDLLTVPVKFENLEGGDELFPHIYGFLSKDAVIGVARLEQDNGGNFQMPEFS